MHFLRWELSPNFEYMLTLPGFAKVLTIVFGVIAEALGSAAYEDDLGPEDDLGRRLGAGLWKEILFIILVPVCVILSFVYLAAHCVRDQLVTYRTNKIIDLSFHITAFVVYIVCSALLIDSAVDIEKSQNCSGENLHDYCEFFEKKLGGGIFGIIAGVTYALTAIAIALVKNL